MLNENVQVPDEGPNKANIIVIDEFPWVQEVYEKRPLCGQAGKLQDRWWREIGLERNKLHIMHMYPFQPPKREAESIDTGELVKWLTTLNTRISDIEDAKVIVTLGNYATYALTGKGKIKANIRNAITFEGIKVSEAERKAGITQLRGSIYNYTDKSNRKLKVIPIIHPMAVLQHQKWEKRTICDWKRVKRESETHASQELNRKHITQPSVKQAENFTKMIECAGNNIIMSIDIETWGKTLTCIGFAINPQWSITLPISGNNAALFMPIAKRLCESKAQKVLCNGLYDWYWLAWNGIWVNNYLWDVQLMHHALDPADNHSLDYLASIYCNDYRYWKDEAKDAEEIIKYANNLEALWTYNGLDCCYTRELYDILYNKLKQENMLKFYIKHYQMMLEPLIRTMLHGIRVDKEAQKQWAKKLQQDMEGIHKELNEAAGEELFALSTKCAFREPKCEEWQRILKQGEDTPLMNADSTEAPKAKWINKEEAKALGYIVSRGKIKYKIENTKKDFSRIKLMRFFYEKLKLPKVFKRNRAESLDEGAIRKLTAKWPDKIGNYGNLLLAYREKKKECDYLRGAWDKDGRIRCSYKMLTEAGRLSSCENPRGTGYNLQNIKR